MAWTPILFNFFNIRKIAEKIGIRDKAIISFELKKPPSKS